MLTNAYVTYPQYGYQAVETFAVGTFVTVSNAPGKEFQIVEVTIKHTRDNKDDIEVQYGLIPVDEEGEDIPGEEVKYLKPDQANFNVL